MNGYWKKPSIVSNRESDDDGRRVGHICLGPVQFNWGYTPGLRIYLTWPGETKTLFAKSH